jgi:hypothetical protein
MKTRGWDHPSRPGHGTHRRAVNALLQTRPPSGSSGNLVVEAWHQRLSDEGRRARLVPVLMLVMPMLSSKSLDLI